MKRTENQAFCMSSSPRTLDRVPDSRPRLSRKREGTQGRTVHLLLIPTESPPPKPFRVPDIEGAPGAEQLEARDRGGASPPSPGDPQGTSSRARCTEPDLRQSLTRRSPPTSASKSNARYTLPRARPTTSLHRPGGRAEPPPCPGLSHSQSEQSTTGKCPVTPPLPASGRAPGKRTQRSMRLLAAQEAQPSPAMLEAQPELPPAPKLVGILHT